MGLTLLEKQTVFLDTAPFIYFFEENERYLTRLEAFFDQVYRLDVQLITSMVTYIELLTYPTRTGKLTLAAKYRDFLTNSARLSIYPLNISVADVAIQFRAKYKFSTPDAIQLATAQICGADFVLSNDRDLATAEEVNVVLVADL